MAKKSSVLGFFGLFLLLLGFAMFLSGIYYTLFAVMLGLFGISIDIFSTLGIAGIVLGIVMFFGGFKLVIDHETPLIKGLFGIFGIIIFGLGVITAIMGVVSLNAPLALFGLLMTFALGLSMISYGFDNKVKVLKFFGDVMKAFKKSLK